MNIVKKIKIKTRMMFLSNKRTVDFVIAGTQKGGTTALDAYLREHPEICMADKKELHFFDNEGVFAHEKPDYSKYHAWFTPKKSHKLLGESTPVYMYWKYSPKRIWQYNPNMKIIILLRDPIRRAYSHWNMLRTRNIEKLSFWDAITIENKRCKEALPLQNRTYSYIDRGRYLQQLRRIWEYFPKNRTLILKTKELRENPTFTLNQVYTFLGVSQYEKVLEKKNIFSFPYESSLKNKERRYLRSIFAPEIKKLETELNWDCSDWLAC